MSKEKVMIIGGGLAGSLLAIFLSKKGFQVTVYEKRSDPRSDDRKIGGRSINLALSDRGILALEKAGVMDALSHMLIPMKGRMIHHLDGKLHFQPYGNDNQAINSVSRSLLNEVLIEQADRSGVKFFFDHKCESVDIERHIATFATKGKSEAVSADVIIGADGAFSTLRNELQRTDRFNFSQDYIPHGYKELTIEPGADGFRLEPNALHIWPRGQFMLIALPNVDQSFTCTLFLPFEGEQSFSSLQDPQKVLQFFSGLFPDTIPLIPNLTEQFFANPTSSLLTVKCFPWFRNRCLLIGDACHAIVPFYGQGINAGFEDCRIFDELLEVYYPDWDQLFSAFQRKRKPDADAIAGLALDNFIEMRDKVADEQFLWQKKLEALLHKKYPDKWVPLYTMVTFSNMSYHRALLIGKKQEAIMHKIREVYPMSTPPEAIDLEKIVAMLD